MTVISIASFANIAAAADSLGKDKTQSTQGDGFDAFLKLFDKVTSRDENAANGPIASGGLSSDILSVLLGESSVDSASSDFSSDFIGAFGSNGGPLFDYISMLTEKLNLTPEQNQALQDIAVAHKDDAGTPAATASIAAALSAAGITA